MKDHCVPGGIESYCLASNNTLVNMSTFQSDMNNEFKRYATFSGFRSPGGRNLWPTQLAQAGFYRSGTCQEFQVVCFACGLVLNLRTISGDPVMEIHHRLAPSCSFVNGCSNNQPVPPVDSGAALEWLSQNFSFDTLVDTTQHSNSCPNTQGSAGAGSVYSEPILPENFTLSHIVSQLPSLSDLSTLEDSHSQSTLSTLPMDFLNGFANTTLNSVPTAELFQASENSHLQQSQSSSLTVPGELLMIDGVGDGVEGDFPPSAMPDSDISNYMNAIQQQGYSGELGETDVTRKLTFSDLGIITQQPKRPDLAPLQKRLDTFINWRGPAISQSIENIAEAGLYYAGFSDCCRCFYCGGGLKSWEPEDDPWIEHARWFKTCPFILTNKGKDFITAVHSLARTNNNIMMAHVQEEMNRIRSATDQPENAWRTEDPEMDTQTEEDENIESEAERLSDENLSLRQPELCKICLDNEVSIVYVPCGHLVTCATCAPTVKTCPVCRDVIGGQIRIQRTV